MRVCERFKKNINVPPGSSAAMTGIIAGMHQPPPVITGTYKVHNRCHSAAAWQGRDMAGLSLSVSRQLHGKCANSVSRLHTVVLGYCGGVKKHTHSSTSQAWATTVKKRYAGATTCKFWNMSGVQTYMTIPWTSIPHCYVAVLNFGRLASSSVRATVCWLWEMAGVWTSGSY